jgi:hypothetical protein
MFVFSTRYNTIVARQLNPASDFVTEARLLHRTIFATAIALALADMQDPDTKQHWQQVAISSGGKWKTPRGAAFAHYYDSLRKKSTVNSQQSTVAMRR